MKKLLSFAIFALLLNTYLASAQECSRFYPLKEGTTLEYSNYNGKGKAEGKITYHISEVSTSGGVTSAVMHMQFLDDKGKAILSSDYKMSCEGDVVRIDFESLMNNQMMQQFGEAEAEITGTDLEIPNDLYVDQKLNDANMQMKVSMGGMNMNMSVETINRKVEKEESITTPAGTFPCFVIYGENNTKSMMAKNQMSSRTWLSEGVGVVKQENYNKNGKIMGYMELTALSN